MAGPSIGNLKWAGERPGATRLKFSAGDSVGAQVDVGSGNLSVSVKALKLVGVKSDVQVGAWYNSMAADQTADARLGNGWGLDPLSVRVKENSDKSITYTGPGGLTGVFDLKSGSTTSYTSPGGFKVDLVKTGSTWKMTDHQSKAETYFASSGYLSSKQDRDDNLTDLTSSTGPATYSNVAILAPAGPTASRTINVVTDAAYKTTLTQTTPSDSRSVSFQSTVGTQKTVTKFTDALNRETTFGYDTSARLTSIDAPGNVSTAFAYDASNRVTSITQTETSTGGPGNSITRLDYPSSTQTLLADPTTDQASSVSAADHTTYTIDSDNKRVTKAVDAEGRQRSKTYNGNGDESATNTGATGTYFSSTSKTYGANNNESLTKSTKAEGEAMSMSYNNPAGSPSQYSPSGSVDDAKNSSVYTYNGTGNQDSSTDALASKAKLEVDSYGLVSSATAPEHSGDSPISPGDKTLYSYTNYQMSSITPKTGTSLGGRAFTYDTFGRVATATNGRGITATYSYDKMDRVSGESFSDGASVTYGYDAAGQNNSRVDVNGTTSYVYDQLGRLTSRGNTFNGGTFTYGYNKASWLTQSTSTAGGTITYTYDKAGQPASIVYPYNGTTATMRFQVDSHSRRTHTWLGANATHTTWVAHYQVDYTKSDKVNRIRAYQGTGDASNTMVIDTTYCYKIQDQTVGGVTVQGVDIGDSCTADDGVTSVGKLQWKKDNVSGQTIDYKYTKSGRLSDAHVSDGADFNYQYTKNGSRKYNDGTTLTFNDENQLTTTGYSYDGAGNITTSPTLSAIGYTSADQLKTVTKAGTAYTYKHAGADQKELLSEVTPAGTYKLDYGRENDKGIPVIEQASKDANTASVINDPVTGQPLMLRTSSGMQAMYVYDGTPGNPIALITSAAYKAFAYSFDPYGVPTLTEDDGGLSVAQNPYTFAGGIQDRTTGWVHFGNRYYDPKTGTWTQMDTLDAPLQLGNANRYAYAAGDPINNKDPLGEDYIDCVNKYTQYASFAQGAIGGIAGGAIGLGYSGGNLAVGGTGLVAGVAAGSASGLVTGFVGSSIGCAIR